MDLKLDGPSSAGGDPDEFTVARRRSRRVSFAETTAVHVFVRDEDFETPPDSNPSSERSKPGNEEELGLGFRGGRFDSEDDEGDEDGEQEKFIRDMDSSSPSSTFGSVTSNDDDNFFGPVSTSFIKSGRLSECGTSDDNDHDITLDSTAFSLHFQNVVPPDDCSVNSAGSFRTLTGESPRTDSHGIITSKRFMNEASCSTLSGAKSSSVGDLSSMSFAVENPDSYDRYTKSSPTLDALLAKVNKPMQPNSPIYGSGTRTPQHDNHALEVVKESVDDDADICSMNATGKAVDTVFDPNISKGHQMGSEDDWNGIGVLSPKKEASLPIDSLTIEKNQATFSPESNGYSKGLHEVIRSNPLVANVRNTNTFTPPNGRSFNIMTSQSGQIHLEISPDLVRRSKHSLDSSPQSVQILPVLVNVDVQQQLLPEHGMQTPQNAVQSLQSPLLESASSLRSKRQQLYLDPSVLRLNHSEASTTSNFLAEGTVQGPHIKIDGDENMLRSSSLKESMFTKPTEEPVLHDNGLNHEDLQSSQQTISVNSGISVKKRGMEQTFLIGEDHSREVTRMQKSQKVLADTVGSNLLNSSEHDLDRIDEPVGIREQAPEKHLKNILSKVSEATEQLFLPSICKLSTAELDILEDILGELQTARKYERLYTSLRTPNCSGEHQQKRVAEAGSLLDKLVYEKAKLQLKRMKWEKLSNKAKLCRSKIQECAEVKSIYAQFCALNARTVQHRWSQSLSDSNISTTNQVEYDRVTSRRQELEMLDKRLKQMMKAFETSCNIKGTTSCDGIIKLVNDHIEMKSRHRLIQQDLQLWKLCEVVKKNDLLDVVLDYRNVLLQRLTIESRSVSSIVSNKILSNESIEKNFPNMNARVSFEFVFKDKEDNRVFSSRELSQEMLETNLLLGTLLEVLEEVLVSRMECWNLISSTFHLQSSGQLNLRLSFLGFKSGRKMTVSLDLTTLNCAAYPSDTSDLKMQILEAESTFPPLVKGKIVDAVESLENGRSMIARLCRSISHVIRDSNGL